MNFNDAHDEHDIAMLTHKRFLLMITLLFASECFAAQGVSLSAPDEVRELLLKYFDLPDALLSDESARAAFVRRAQQEIGELLATEGYFSPTISFEEAPNGEQRLHVVLGNRTTVSEVNFHVMGEIEQHVDRVDALKQAWSLPINSPFRSADWEKAKTNWLAELSDEYYANAQLTFSQANVDPEKSGAVLTLVLDSGPPFRFGELEITGLQRYTPMLITRAAPFKAGDIYRQDKLQHFQNRLQSMPQFSSVIVSLDPNPDTHDAAPVRVKVEEIKPKRLAVGLGYSTNHGARSEVNFQSNNFYNSAWKFNSMARLEQNRQSLTIGLDTLPNPNGYVLTWGAGSEATKIEGLDTVRNKLSLTRGRTLGQIETRLGISWQQERRLPSNGIDERNQALVLDWQWHRRDLDSLLNPQQGTTTELRFGGATQQLLSDNDFVRAYARQQFWWTLKQNHMLNARIEAGQTFSKSRLGIPQEYLFRAGGSQSVRGYSYQSLGKTEGDAIVGGRSLATMSAEYTYWFMPKWGVATFIDVGGAADTWRTLPWAVGYGAGPRWRSPVGPLALDLAWGVNSKSLQLHFSLAVGF